MKRRTLLSHAVVVIAASTSLLVGSSALATNAGQSATCFTVYDNTSYTDVDVSTVVGIDEANIIYPSSTWKTKFAKGELPTQGDFVDVIQDATKPGPIVLDFETIYLTTKHGETDAVVQRRAEMWTTMLQWAQAATSKPVGAWGFPENTAAAYRDLAKGPAVYMDAWFVSVYRDSLWSYADWNYELTLRFNIANGMNAAIPIFIYISPNFTTGPDHGDFMDGDVWRSQLDRILQIADGIVIWSSADLPIVGPNTGWLDETVSFVDALPDC